MTEARKVVRREPEVFEAFTPDEMILKEPLDRDYWWSLKKNGIDWFLIPINPNGIPNLQSGHSFHATFIDADQYEREQRDKVIRELIDRTNLWPREDQASLIRQWINHQLKSEKPQ